MKQRWSSVLYSKKGIRIVYPLLLAAGLIFLAELLIVDPLSSLLFKLGIPDVSGILPESGSEAIGDGLKRSLRTALVLLIVGGVLKKLLHSSYSEIGFRFGKSTWSKFGMGLGLGFLIQFIAIGLMSLFGWFEFQGFVWNYTKLDLLLPAFLYTLVFCLETGFIEEVLFRGLVFHLFEKRYTVGVAVIVSAGLFGVLHFSGFNTEFSWWMSLLSSFLTGLLFVQAYLLYRNLWLPIGLHAGWHLAMRVLGSVGLASNEAVFMVTKVEGPVLWVSTKAGGAGICELAGVAVIMLLLWLWKICR